MQDTYASLTVRLIPWPVPAPAGDGWWRHSWNVEHGTEPMQVLPSLPPPPKDLRELALLLSVTQPQRGRLRVEVLSPHETLVSPEVGYISLLMQALESSVGPLVIDGHRDHPILRMSKSAA
jgi:hypothetical protein